jgi:membrane-bound ClpP family serine protease
VPAGRQAKNVAIITIHEQIDANTAVSVRRRLEEAVRAKADAIVIDLDTPGGEIGAVLEICTAIKRSPVGNIVAWVNPQAYSGGAIIAVACREIVVADAATMGDAAPIAVAMGMFLNTLPETERAKLLAPLLQEVVDSARERGYDEKVVQGFVSLGVELWMIESVERPGEVLFIDRAEYRTLFGGDPAAATPVLVGPSAVPDGVKKADPPKDLAQEMAQGLKNATRRPGGSRRKAPTGEQGTPPPLPAAGPGETTFVPGSEGMSPALARDVNSGLDTPSKRPVLTEADRGKWTLVTYVSDGRTLYTMKERDLFTFRLASRAQTASGTVNNDEELRAFLGATYLARMDRTPLEATAAFLSNFLIKGLLIAVFLIGVFIEMVHPGLIVPGSVAAVALLLLLAPAIILGMGAWWQVAAIVVGIALLAVEVFIMPGFGVFGVLGLVGLFGGLVGTFSGSAALFPDSPGQGDALYGVVTVLVAMVTAMGITYGVTRHLGRLPVLSRLVLHTRHDDDAGSGLLDALGPAAGVLVSPGDVGETLTPLRPSGRARFDGAMVDVVTQSGYVSAGQTVRVIEADAFRVVVEPTGVAQVGPRSGPAGLA